MDINDGPLLRAVEHIKEHGLEEQIETRRSDGVRELEIGECDCIVVAGMGGALTIKILEEGEAVLRHLKEMVLQPQSEISKVRAYLNAHGYVIVDEDMVCDDGKFYPMMKVINGQAPTYTELELRYGKCLLENGNSVLKEFLKKERKVKSSILQNISMESGSHIEARRRDLEEELEEIKDALQRYYSCD